MCNKYTGCSAHIRLQLRTTTLFNIFAVTESWFSTADADADFDIDDYERLRSDRKGTGGYGVWLSTSNPL